MFLPTGEDEASAEKELRPLYRELRHSLWVGVGSSSFFYKKIISGK